MLHSGDAGRREHEDQCNKRGTCHDPSLQIAPDIAEEGLMKCQHSRQHGYIGAYRENVIITEDGERNQQAANNGG